MNDLLREIAGLSRIGGPVPVRVLADEMSDGFCLIRTARSPVVEVVARYDGSDAGRREAEGLARVLSGAPVMLDLLVSLLVRWNEAVEEDTEINGGDAVDWLSRFIPEVRQVLEQVIGPQSPRTLPLPS